MIKKALIIAAGSGSRLQRNENDTPKPLRRVAGLPLIQRILLTAKRAGIQEFVVVVGYQKDKIIKALSGKNLGVKIQFVENSQWEKPNGVSVLAAKPYLQENFVLLMADHVFETATLEEFRRVPLNENKTLLAIDYKLPTIFDMDDATKVKVENGKIQSIGKQLTDYNAVDTGMFASSPALFEALEEASRNGKFSLSDGIQILSSRNQMGTFDVGEAFWQDVDTAETLQYAEKYLLNACRKPTDGFISRNFNRYISLAITRVLMNTPLSANQFTAFVSILGLLSGILAAQGTYWPVVWGGFLFKMTSILDGCDGELSKLKLTNSKLGQWLDTISDNLTYLAFIIGTVVGVARQGNPHVAITGTLTIFGLVMTLTVMFIYLIRKTDSGSLIAIQQDFKREAKNAGWLKKTFAALHFMIKRDFFALVFFIFTIFGKLDWILWGCLIGSNVTWMVLLKTWVSTFRSAEPTLTKETPNL